MVALDEYGFRRLGHDGVVDQSLHQSRATLEYVVGVFERGGGAQMTRLMP